TSLGPGSGHVRRRVPSRGPSLSPITDWPMPNSSWRASGASGAKERAPCGFIPVEYADCRPVQVPGNQESTMNWRTERLPMTAWGSYFVVAALLVSLTPGSVRADPIVLSASTDTPLFNPGPPPSGVLVSGAAFHA